MKKHNRLVQVWLFLLLLLGATMLLFYFPKTIFGIKLREADIFSELRTRPNETPTQEQEARPELPEDQWTLKERKLREMDKKRAQRQEVNNRQRKSKGLNPLVYIEDFSPERNGLAHLFRAIRKKDITHRSVYTAFLGDSFIEGDIFTIDVRKLLQEKWGGWGVSWMPFCSNVSGFRQGVRHSFSGWSERTLIDKKVPSDLPLSGRSFTADGSAQVHYDVQQGPADGQRIVGKLYYRSPRPISLVCKMGDRNVSARLEGGEGLRCETFPLTGKVVDLSFPSGTAGGVLYGFSLEGAQGVAVDNFSLRGNSGLALASSDATINAKLNSVRPYSLLVLQFGLNVANARQKDYSNYGNKMLRIINQLKSQFPNASLLLMSISDRAQRRSGSFETMGGVQELRNEQRRIARSAGILFWDTFAAMGGKNSMKNFVSDGRAAKDYTHMTFKGGKYLAEQFVDALLFEQGYYDHR